MFLEGRGTFSLKPFIYVDTARTCDVPYASTHAVRVQPYQYEAEAKETKVANVNVEVPALEATGPDGRRRGTLYL